MNALTENENRWMNVHHNDKCLFDGRSLNSQSAS